MLQALIHATLLSPLLLLACLLIPNRHVRLLKTLGIHLPVVVFGAFLLAVGYQTFSGATLRIEGSFGANGPWSDLTFVLLDRLSGVLLLMVSFLGLVIARYSRHYMAGEPREGFYYKWLCGTLGSVLCVILSGNLILLSLAWMATSLSLHHLLLFYPERRAAQIAARKKFVISRLGDCCMVAAVALIGLTFGSFDYPALFEQAAAIRAGELAVPGWSLHAIGLLLALGALMKSAQFPFHTWLPDTLETPTPVSALMHAGIINAGGYLIVRLSPIVALSTPSLSLLALVGGLTAVFAGLVMLTQTSVKKALAFSTVGQMGFMILQCGLGAYALAILHIVAHSLYKAHAFLSSGELPANRTTFRPPSPATVGLTLVLATVAFVGINHFVGPFTGPASYQWLLGLVVVLGLAQLLTHGLSGFSGSHRQVILKSALGLILISALYGLLHAGSRVWLEGVVAPTPAIASLTAGLVPISIVGLFVAGFALSYAALRYPRSELMARIHTHVSHAFYCNTLANRCLQLREVLPSVGQPCYRPGTPVDRTLTEDAAARAAARIAPLWPLQHFVAVNPYLGYANQPFSDAAQQLNRVTGASAVPPLADFRDLLTDPNCIDDRAIRSALQETDPQIRESLIRAGIALNPEGIRAAAWDQATPPPEACHFQTFAEFIDLRPDGYWQRFITEDLSRRCAAYFDRVQAVWTAAPGPGSLFTAWREGMQGDLNPDLAGLTGFRKAVSQLPDSRGETIAWALEILRIPASRTVDFMEAELFSLRGWAGFCQYLKHQAKLSGSDNDLIIDLLAIRLVYDALLAQSKAGPGQMKSWQTRLELINQNDGPAIEPELALRCLLQEAFEHSRRAPLLDQLTASPSPGHTCKNRPTLQAIFCIDVRSEVYRRALEAQSPEVETFGFAGFFGLPLRHPGHTDQAPTARCPVLLSPSVELCSDSISHGPEPFSKVWKSFQKGMPACFPFVETIGLTYAWKIASSSFPAAGSNPAKPDGETPAVQLTAKQRIQAAATILTHLGLKEGFGKVVLFAGHGSHTTNNPHSSAYDCGACGGHAGDLNARVAAALFNDPEVRAGLDVVYGIQIPADTTFLAGCHNTTTDVLTLFTEPALAPHHQPAIDQVRQWLLKSSAAVRRWRAPSLGLDHHGNVDQQIQQRSLDWSQTRPEWGLAGNFAFVAAPRSRTRSLNLGGRVFLHNYDPALDPEDKTLELILTAPVVVANWINLQYYASTVDQPHFGSGSKTIHNIAAGIGVLSGNGGDLRTGLPIQALRGPDQAIHEALRLHVCIEADPEAIDRILARHQTIGDLVENRWLHLFAIVDGGCRVIQRIPNGGWTRSPGKPANSPAEKPGGCDPYAKISSQGEVSRIL